MVSLKLENFGGMIPAVNDYYLPPTAAALSQNAWVYTGALEGFRELRNIYTCSSAAARKVFRIPLGFFDKDRITNSYWMEFTDPDTDVLRSPLANDQFDRYYWASPSHQPLYNTKNRITSASKSGTVTLSIASPCVATRNAHGLAVGDPVYFTTGGSLPTGVTAGQYYFVTAVTTNTFNFSATPGGSNVNTSGTQSGTHTVFFNQPLKLGVPAPGTAPTVSNNQPSATVTITIASPAVITWNGHGLAANDPVSFTTTGALPTGITPNTTYYVMTAGLGTNAFQISATVGGTAITTSGTQSGTHTGYKLSTITEVRAYVYTWVTAYGEEGPPSNPSNVLTTYANGTVAVALSNPTNSEAAQRNIKFVNIYRAVTGSTGAATYFLVAQLPIGTTSYTDSTANVSGNNQLQSLYWSEPPTDLKGMIALPNGMVAGFRSNEIWFCEPYRLHAWPVAYTISVDYPIIGLGVIGQTVIVCTAVSPYAVSGVTPSAMSMSRLSTGQSCLSRGSIVSSPAGVLYAAPEGLIVATPGGVTLPTREMVTKDKWGDLLNLSTLRATLFTDGYYCWGSAQGVVFQSDAFQPDAFQAGDVTGGYTGAYIDFFNTRVSYNKLSGTTPVLNAFSDVWTGEVFVLKDGIVYWLDVSANRPYGSYVWRSKIFTMPNRRNIEAMRVWFDTFPDTPALNPVRNTDLVQTLQADQWGLVRIYADGNLVMCREMREDGEFMRLPSGFKAATYQVEIEARVRITQIELATSAKELINA